jgi:hypothetical protein
MPRLLVTILAALLLAPAALAPPALAKDKDDALDWPALERITPDPAVQGRFLGKHEGEAAQDLSGIACRPDGGGALDCVVVNDEGLAAQRVRITGRTLTPGQAIPLVGRHPPIPALGRPPERKGCEKAENPDENKEFDGEGVAFAPHQDGGGTFYIVGSHGCSRKHHAFRPANFLLARVRVNPAGQASPAELTWRVTDVLAAAEPVNGFLRKRLMEENGLNIEGIAAVGDALFLGLRAPSIGTHAFIVATSARALFAPDANAPPAPVRVHKVALAKDYGIRDLTALADGRLLVLVGPAQEQTDVPFGLVLFQPATDKTTPIGWIADVAAKPARAKAEAITVIGRDGDALRVLVLFDGIVNGGPREYRVWLPR